VHHPLVFALQRVVHKGVVERREDGIARGSVHGQLLIVGNAK
jgi:hypothetical protein